MLQVAGSPSPTPIPTNTPVPTKMPVDTMSWWDHIEPLILTWFPILFMALIVFFLWRMIKLMPRTKPQEIKPDSEGSIKWEEVAGADEAKAELQEVVDFLRDPERFRRLGAKVPKGILLHGPPGTGKTLLAKAVANESGAQFFAQSAASFVEMFAGLGAARIRRLFGEARKHRPAIVFIDEIDAVGAVRGSDNNSEREQTLNQLLVEMDGFASTGDLVVIAASNLLEKLDPALLRPGRFDRQILVSPPDVGGREAILNVHTRNKKLGDVDLTKIARQTAGLTGADLANIANEAAIAAGRGLRPRVEQAHFDAAIERVVAGMQSRRALTEHERRVVAYHEAGHALCSELLPSVDRTHKISIIPRGQALGYVLHFPEEDRYLKNRDELMDQMTGLLGGRAAEEIVFGSVTTGASDDLKRVAAISRSMIHEWAMGTSVSALQLAAEGGAVSDRTRELRDAEQQHLADEAMRRAMKLLTDHRAQLDQLAAALLRHEVLEREDIEQIMGDVPRRPRASGGLRVVAAEPTNVQQDS
jgi:cell division protease FtsH